MLGHTGNEKKLLLVGGAFMELKITEDKRNELLKRREITAEFDEKTVPSRQAIRQKISAMIDVPIERVVVQKVDARFGSQKASVYAKAYDDAANMKITERKFVMERNFGKEKKATVAGEAAPPAKFKK